MSDEVSLLEQMPVRACVPLTSASYRKCSRLLERGEVKRVMQRSINLVGYFIACPQCGFSASYLHEDCGYVEQLSESKEFPHQLISITNPQPCFRCRAYLCVEDGKLVARGGSKWPL